MTVIQHGEGLGSFPLLPHEERMGLYTQVVASAETVGLSRPVRLGPGSYLQITHEVGGEGPFLTDTFTVVRYAPVDPLSRAQRVGKEPFAVQRTGVRVNSFGSTTLVRDEGNMHSGEFTPLRSAGESSEIPAIPIGPGEFALVSSALNKAQQVVRREKRWRTVKTVLGGLARRTV